MTNEDDGMVNVLRPERGRFTVETVERWATEVLLREEGIVAEDLSIDESIHILHRHNFARIER